MENDIKMTETSLAFKFEFLLGVKEGIKKWLSLVFLGS